MTTYSTASTGMETRKPLSNYVRRRALRIINNSTYDNVTRQFIQYALNINDPWTPSMVRRAERGEDVVDNLYTPFKS